VEAAHRRDQVADSPCRGQAGQVEDSHALRHAVRACQAEATIQALDLVAEARYRMVGDQVTVLECVAEAWLAGKAVRVTMQVWVPAHQCCRMGQPLMRRGEAVENRASPTAAEIEEAEAERRGYRD
jgi:hypothetical protein